MFSIQDMAGTPWQGCCLASILYYESPYELDLSDSINIIKSNLTLGFNPQKVLLMSNKQVLMDSDTITQTHTSEAPACLSRPHPFFFPLLLSRRVVFSFLPQSQKLPGTKDVIGYLSNSIATSLVTGDARTPVIGRRCTILVSGYW